MKIFIATSVIIFLAPRAVNAIVCEFKEFVGSLTTSVSCIGEEFTSINVEKLVKHFPNLENLMIRNTSLTEIPSGLEKLKKLKNLIFTNNCNANDFTAISKLVNLRCIDISFNSKLVEVPKEIKFLKNLLHLSLNGNNFLSIPKEIGELRNLKNLSLNDNKITSLPSEIGLLKDLVSLSINSNSLIELPFEFNKLINLISLSIKGNQFESFPNQVFRLANLEFLFIDDNKISHIPSEIENLKKLQILSIVKNMLESVSDQIGELQMLRVLDIRNNILKSLTGKIGKLLHLKCLFLDFNRLVELPKEIFALKSLKKLSVKNNHLKSIPAEIGDFENIIEILFNFNRLEVLPDSIKNLKSKLEILDLSHNPMIADGLVGSMGHAQLASMFLQKFIFQEPWQPANFVAISADAVYKKLKSQQIHWNFEMLKKAKFKPVPKNKLSASSIMSLIDLQLSSKIRNNANLIIFKNYVKKLYLPQFTYKNWEMDIKYVEDAKDLIESIITTLVKLENINDLEMINSNINALCDGIQHCPDRQMAELKICHNIIVGEINFGNSLIDFILNHIAIQKERILDAIVTPAGKNDNVHALNYWKYILNEELGLNFDFTSYFGTINQDIFFGHKGNVLDAFFKIFTPKLIVESLTIAINNSGPMVCKVLQAIENKEFGDMEMEGMFIYSGQIMDTAFASAITSEFVKFYLIYNDILHNLSKKRKSSENDEHISKSARIH